MITVAFCPNCKVSFKDKLQMETDDTVYCKVCDSRFYAFGNMLWNLTLISAAVHRWAETVMGKVR